MTICRISMGSRRVSTLRRWCFRLNQVSIRRASCSKAHSSHAVFSWRTTLSSNLFNTSPRQSIPSLNADLAFTLLTYAFTLSNLARTNVESLGNYEHARATTEAERKAKDEKLQSAVMLLRKASGVFKYISEMVIPEWERMAGTALTSRPPEMTQEVTSALSK